MKINDIMTNGKIDGQKMYQFSENSPAESWEDFDMLAGAINAYIDGFKPQETPITPERLQAAGFEIYTPGIWLKTVDGVSIISNQKTILLEDDRSLIKFPHINTMEALSDLHKGLTGHPLTWLTPYERTVKELEGMGFRFNSGIYTKLNKDSYLISLSVMKDGEIYGVSVGKPYYQGVKTTAQLRELLALLEGKNE